MCAAPAPAASARALFAAAALLLLVLLQVARAAPSEGQAAEGQQQPQVFDTYPEGPCEAGAEALYQCNTCTCSRDGTRYMCTRRFCPPEPTVEREKRDTRCTPGSRFPHDDGCNTCVCPESGQRSGAACTLKACAN